MTRVSVNRGDAGYSQFCVAQAHGKKVFVFLDGKEVRDCVTADDERGFVVRCVLDDRGNVQADPVDPDTIWQERVMGNVEIRFE